MRQPTPLQMDRQTAQNELLASMMAAFCDDSFTNGQLAQMEIQARRVERLFGLVPGSCLRGA